MKNVWVRHGFWNTLEQGVTRIADAVISLVLLSVLAPEVFSRLALAQAAISPILFLMVSPEAVFYRDFRDWKAEGADCLARHLRAFRFFAYGKLLVAILMSFLLAAFGSAQISYAETWAAFLWGFAMVLSPQVSGPDREFLRLSLQLQDLNAITIFQKITLMGGTIYVALAHGGDLFGLAVVTLASLVATAALARLKANRTLSQWGASRTALEDYSIVPFRSSIAYSLKTFSIWNHTLGVILNWVQTMDVFFLGALGNWAGVSARTVGLYAAALKLANFSTAVPVALGNLFSLWMNHSQASDKKVERKKLTRYSGLLFLAGVFQAGLMLFLIPVALELLSRGRWSQEEQNQMVVWFRWMVAGSTCVGSMYLYSTWGTLRTPIPSVVRCVYIPWGIFSALVYSGSIALRGVEGAAFANVIVGFAYVLFWWVYDFFAMRRLA